ncbi:MAG: TIGR03862 family flavoprotein [Rhodobacterales bacterium]
MKTAVVIGAGPAGLMAAEMLADRGHKVILAEAKPSVGRKLQMAGKSGLNLTKDEDFETFINAYGDAKDWLLPMLAEFSNKDVVTWAQALNQEVFTGSTGRVFPKAMKASPLLRAWMLRLNDKGLIFKTKYRWTGFEGQAVQFETPNGPEVILADAVVLALGGASWARLGSDGAWAPILVKQDIEIAPFLPANVGFSVNWSQHMVPHFGQPVKSVALIAGQIRQRGEFIISSKGVEGSGIYAVSRALRDGAGLAIDLFPDLTLATIKTRLEKPQGKNSLANHLRKVLKFDTTRLALLQECARPLPKNPELLAAILKSLPIPHNGPRPIDEAISTAGGVARSSVDDSLMLKALPGVFVAGEMLDWEAPTGGYLITACMATGRHAGLAAADFLDAKDA